MNRSLRAYRRTFRPVSMGAWCNKKERMICPFCGMEFDRFEDLIEHQDDEGHVIEP